MDLLLLLIIFALFALPTILVSRASRKRTAQAQEMQASAKPGDRIVTVSGFHGVIIAGDAETVEVEIAPGTVATMERAGVLRIEQPEQPAGAAPVEELSAGDTSADEVYGAEESRDDHPEDIDFSDERR